MDKFIMQVHVKQFTIVDASAIRFKFFYVGRDHAGAENLYSDEAAIKLVKKNSSKFKIKSFISKGGFYCLKCKKYMIKGECEHKNLKNILN